MAHKNLLSLSWNLYVKKLLKVEKTCNWESLEERILVLYECRALFSSGKSFFHLSDEDRLLIAGLLPAAVDEPDWFFFGNMLAAGYFRRAVRDNKEEISNALDLIPLSGNISKDQFLNFISTFKLAFEDSKGAGLATATRLLAMKRPDWFLCIDSKNREAVQMLLSSEEKKLPLNWTISMAERYWDEVIGTIQSAVWYNSPEPTDDEIEREVWLGRVALLDMLFYLYKEEKEGKIENI